MPHARGLQERLLRLAREAAIEEEPRGRDPYNYRVYERLVVSPRDVWVKEPVAGKKVVSLQTCFPAPAYEKRLIVRGELVK